MRNKLLVTLLIVVILVVYYLFGMDYMKQRKEHEVLTSDISEVSQILGQIPEPPQELLHDLEQQLAAVNARLAAEQSAFPGEINSTQVINAILELADDCDVKAIPLVTQPWSIENVGEHGYYVLRLNVAVEGGFSQVLLFATELENGEYETLIVEDLIVTRASEQSEEEATVPEDTMPVSASLDLAIYTQSLSSD